MKNGRWMNGENLEHGLDSPLVVINGNGVTKCLIARISARVDQRNS